MLSLQSISVAAAGLLPRRGGAVLCGDDVYGDGAVKAVLVRCGVGVLCSVVFRLRQLAQFGVGLLVSVIHIVAVLV